MRIHEMLKDGRRTNCTKLARDLEVSTKTVMRDLACMRDQLALPAEYDASTFSWHYTRAVDTFPSVKVTERELFAVLVAQKALELYKGTPYHDQLAQAFEKLSAGLRDQVSFSPSSTLQNVSFHHSGLGRADLKLFEKLTKAVNESVEIEFMYRKLGQKNTEGRCVQPYHLANRENSWYLVGFDQQRRALRNFAVGRISGVVLTTRAFVRPGDFSPESHYGKAFGAFVGSGEYRVVIVFSAAVADQVQERFWHESQETKVLTDGRVQFTVQLGALDEILRWVLGWAEQAEVISPKELRTLVAQRAAATAEQYQITPRKRGR